jgi:plasmid stabilization system protein ParE
MTLVWHPETEEEINEGVDFYLKKRLGIEVEFIDELEAAVRRLIKDPSFPREFDAPYRRVVTDRFPYQIVYRLSGERILIVAVMHQSRRPYYWKEREETWGSE